MKALVLVLFATVGCVSGDDTTGPKNDAATTNDASSSDAGSDVGATCDASEPFSNLDINCEGSASPYTCMTTSGLACGATANDCSQVAYCISPTYCTGQPCCLTASQLVTLGCPGTISLNASDDLTTCGTGGICPQGAHVVCQTDSQCPPNQKCHPVQANGTPFGVCQ